MRRRVDASLAGPVYQGPVGRKAAAAVALMALFAVWIGSTEARAAVSPGSSYVYSHSFANQGQLAGAGHLAVEPGTGNIIIGDPSSFQANAFAPGSGPGDGPIANVATGIYPTAVSIDQSSAAVYLESSLFGTLQRWLPDGAATPTYTLDPSFEPQLQEYTGVVAVDPASGDLLVAEPTAREIVRLSPAGNEISSFPAPFDTRSQDVLGITVGSGGIYTVEQTSEGSNKVRRFGANGQSLGVLSVRGNPQAIAWNSATEAIDVAVNRGGKLWVEGLDSSEEHIFEFPFPEALAESEAFGMAVNAESNEIYVLAQTGGFFGTYGVTVYDPVPTPGSEAPTVSAVTITTAHIRTEVDPGAGPPAGSFAYFEYSNDGGTTWTPTATQEVTAAGSVEAELPELRPNDHYQVRAVVGNDLGRHATNSTPFATLTEAPTATTGPAANVDETTATLTGSVTPFAQQTTFHFEYGPTTAYGSRAPVTIDAVSGEGRAKRAVSRVISGLQPSTTYHYRLAAASPAGTSYGADLTLTTDAVGSLGPSRAYEQVTPVEKGSGIVNSVFGFGDATNSSFSYVIQNPAGAEGSPLFGRGYSRRGTSNWEYGGMTDPPYSVTAITTFDTTLAVSAESAKAFVASNRRLAPGAIEGGANLYVVDLPTRSYTLVAATQGPNDFNSFVGTTAQNKFLYANSDLSTIIFASALPLLGNVSSPAIYRWSETAGLQLESKVEGGGLPPSTGAVLYPNAGFKRTVSTDGRRVYYSLYGEDAGVYLNENGQARPISVSHRAGDPSTPVEGEILGTGSDGRYAYITSPSPLTEDASGTAYGVYRYDAVTGELIFMNASIDQFGTQYAALGVSEDGLTFYFTSSDGSVHVLKGSDQRQVPSSGALGIGFAEISADGRYLAFVEGEDPSFPNKGTVYRYDDVTGQTSCASCAVNGTDPGKALFPETEHYLGNEIPRDLDDQGDLFFSTTSSLLPSDTNGVSDVYELNHDGTLRTITSGRASFPAFFGEVSPDGRDVYFTTAQALVTQDIDQAVDVYDARIGGGFPAQNIPAGHPCEGEACTANSAGPHPSALNGSEAGSGAQPPKAKKSQKHKPLCRKKSAKKRKSRCTVKHSRHRKHSNNKGRKSR